MAEPAVIHALQLSSPTAVLDSLVLREEPPPSQRMANCTCRLLPRFSSSHQFRPLDACKSRGLSHMAGAQHLPAVHPIGPRVVRS